jgi:hypothetical protein
MKRLLLVFCLLTISLGFNMIRTGTYAHAYDAFTDVCAQNPQATTCADINKTNSQCGSDINCLNPLSGNDGILMRVVKLLSFVTGVASVIIIILAGLKYVTADGDSNSITSAKHTIQYGLVGLVVTIVAEAIILFVIKGLN